MYSKLLTSRLSYSTFEYFGPTGHHTPNSQVHFVVSSLKNLSRSFQVLSDENYLRLEEENGQLPIVDLTIR